MSDTLQPRSVEVQMIQNGVGLLFASTTKLRLFVAGPTIGPETSLSDLTEATFPGYAAVDLSILPIVGIAPDGSGIAKNSASLLFSAATILTPQMVGGWYATDNPAVNLFAAGMFDAPIAFVNTGDQLVITPFIHAFFMGDSDTEFIAGP